MPPKKGASASDLSKELHDLNKTEMIKAGKATPKNSNTGLKKTFKDEADAAESADVVFGTKKPMTAAETSSQFLATVMFGIWMVFIGPLLLLWMLRTFPGMGGFSVRHALLTNPPTLLHCLTQTRALVSQTIRVPRYNKRFSIYFFLFWKFIFFLCARRSN
jgi:hypothetical protein